MGGQSSPAPLGTGQRQCVIDKGTRSLTAMPAASDDRNGFESAFQVLQAEFASFWSYTQVDGAARLNYSRQLVAMADEQRALVAAGRSTWKRAAEIANSLRNTIMDELRNRSTPVGRAWAQSIKAEGLTLNELIARKTLQLYPDTPSFHSLPPASQNEVYKEVVKSAAKSNPRINALLGKLTKVGRGLLVVTIAISVYKVATAEDKASAASHEVAVTGAGITGGVAGGALAGLACGPGAPICVAVGAFVGGVVAASGVEFFW